MFSMKKKSEDRIEIYKTEIKSIGNLAKDFLQEKMLILFGNEAPDGLKDYCFGIDVTSVHDKIETGHYLSIDNHRFKITAVGRLVQKNLADLGHITMRFDGSTKADLAGTLYLENRPIPDIGIGTQIAIGW